MVKSSSISSQAWTLLACRCSAPTEPHLSPLLLLCNTTVSDHNHGRQISPVSLPHTATLSFVLFHQLLHLHCALIYYSTSLQIFAFYWVPEITVLYFIFGFLNSSFKTLTPMECIRNHTFINCCIIHLWSRVLNAQTRHLLWLDGLSSIYCW